ncbi:MAG: biopolymer transporter ExbD [Blastocatellia bacterium]|nr:biopolymer transporter ExbD [Blastocatellia bacterium]
MSPLLPNRNQCFFLSASLFLLIFTFYFMFIYPGCLGMPNVGILHVTARDRLSLVVVRMDLAGAVQFNGQPVSSNQLSLMLKQEFDRLPPELRTLTIEAPKGISYGQVVKCLDGLQNIGATQTKLVYSE